MKEYYGKTLEEWRKYIKEDKIVGIRATKYILVLEELIEELQSKLHQHNVISSICISCDEQKETHELCMDCIKKIINENNKTSL